MKKAALLFLFGIFLNSFGYSQSDSLSPSSLANGFKARKNNCKLFNRISNAYLIINYERALSKKWSLSLELTRYQEKNFSNITHRKSEITPAVTYYLSKLRKNKYNRGFYLTMALPFEDYKYTNYKVLKFNVSEIFGYQFILGRRIALNTGLELRTNFYNLSKVSTDTKYHKPIGYGISSSFYIKIGLGYTF